MINVNLGDYVHTYNGHYGKVVKKYHVTGVSGLYVHIKENDGRIYYCHMSEIFEVYARRKTT